MKELLTLYNQGYKIFYKNEEVQKIRSATFEEVNNPFFGFKTHDLVAVMRYTGKVIQCIEKYKHNFTVFKPISF